MRDILVTKLVKCRSIRIESYNEIQQRDTTEFLTPGDAVGIILSIVAETNLAIRFFALTSDKGTTGRLDTKPLHILLCRRPEPIAAWAHLEELILDCSMTSDHYDWALDLIAYALRLRKLSLRFYSEYPGTTSSFMQRLTFAHVCRGLQDLSLESAGVTVKIMAEFLLQNRDTLRALSFRHVTVADGGKWARVLESMKGNLPRLERLSLFWLKEDKSGKRPFVVFSKLAENPILPGSAKRLPNGVYLKSDRRLIKSLERPIKLTYRWVGGKRRVFGASYIRPRMDNFLNVLAKTAETL